MKYQSYSLPSSVSWSDVYKNLFDTQQARKFSLVTIAPVCPICGSEDDGYYRSYGSGDSETPLDWESVPYFEGGCSDCGISIYFNKCGDYYERCVTSTCNIKCLISSKGDIVKFVTHKVRIDSDGNVVVINGTV